MISRCDTSLIFTRKWVYGSMKKTKSNDITYRENRSVPGPRPDARDIARTSLVDLPEVY